MGAMEDPFETTTTDELVSDFAVLTAKPRQAVVTTPLVSGGAVIGRLHGFDISDRPLVGSLAALPGQVATARTCVALRREMLESEVVVVYENGDPTLPIIVGILQKPTPRSEDSVRRPPIVTADEERYVISAEREIVLRCGDASITLTRAGKVILKGRYVLSRSSGYNKIKGAAIDIN